MKVGIIGIGKMGGQIAKKLHEDKHTVIVSDTNKSVVDEFKVLGMTPAYSREEVISAFNGEQVALWLMIPSNIVDQELDAWLALVPKGSILIDGGNSDFRLTKVRSEKVSVKGSTFMDVGTSGGVWGYKNGFSM